MKKRFLSMVLLLAFVFGMGVPVAAYDGANARLTEEEVAPFITEYFTKRVALQDDATALDGLAADGTIEDELIRVNRIWDEATTVLDSTVDVYEVEMEDKRVFAYVDEIVTYEVDGEVFSELVPHTLILGRYSHTVDSDGYREYFSEFTSSAYVPPEDEVWNLAPQALLNSETDPCIVSVALSQEGYHEKANNSQLDSFTANSGSANWTKYNAYFSLENVEWCYSFVSWCARMAGVSKNICPTKFSTSDGMDWFVQNNRFGYRGNYTPEPGDIFFWKAGTKEGHVGLVTGVSGSTVYTIEGNSNDQVRCKSYSLTNSSITGYGKISDGCHDIGWVYSANYHWKGCSYCDYETGSRSQHTFVYRSGMYVCSVCGYKTNKIPEISRMP